MKFLCKYRAEDVFHLRDALDDNGISCSWEEEKGLLEFNRGGAGKSPWVKIFVSEHDYDKAVDLLKEGEAESAKRVKKLSKDADKAAVIAGIVVIAIIILMYILGPYI